MMPSFLVQSLLFVALAVRFATAISLDVNSTDSIRNASAALAYGLMSLYTNNQSNTPYVDVGTLPAPYYWWEAGAVWGGMIDYWAYTQDDSYVPAVSQALLAQVGPDDNYMPPAYFSSLGNDDQMFWAAAALSALEYDFPVPSFKSSTLWLDLAQAVWNTQVARWDTTSCNGGLRWQIFPSAMGYTYKNTISNGGFFSMSARLLHYTGNQTYGDWAEKSWNWLTGIGLVDPTNYNVFDGSADPLNCSQVDHDLWTYNVGVMLYGTAMMYNYTNGSTVWEGRLDGLVSFAANSFFFSSSSNASYVMYEPGCETESTCDDDEYSFKAYLSRWMAKSAIVAPFIGDVVWTLLSSSAVAAAQSCRGPSALGNTTCGTKWYVGGYDGVTGVGQELSALETVQGLLLLHSGGINGSSMYPDTQSNVHVQVETATTQFQVSTQTSDYYSAGTAPARSTAVASPSYGATVLPASGVWFLLAVPLILTVIFGGLAVR